ncbi:metallophosphoesterase family protein [Psychromonas ingrahamii]|uniref:hypothetical protein n=1 Tax=Psychromonas ingrahamii TaxID=357794 RepID=UPI00031FD3AF|nr:hypothetical protein [Psychromonas ingrahamii]
MSKAHCRKKLYLTLTVATLAGEVGVTHAQYPFNQWPVKKKEITGEDYKELLWERLY